MGRLGCLQATLGISTAPRSAQDDNCEEGHPNITCSFVDCWSAATPCPARLQTRFSHKPPSLHKRFRHTCGSRGKQGPLDATNEQFSKCPQLHSLDLENSPVANLFSPQ